jgi:hypothetical protein
VKSGKTGPGDVRDLRGVMDREKAAIGVFITLEDPTKDMEKEAASAGFYLSPFNRQKTSRLQIITVADLVAGSRPTLPHNRQTFAYPIAPRARAKKAKQGSLVGDQAQAPWPPAIPALANAVLPVGRAACRCRKPTRPARPGSPADRTGAFSSPPVPTKTPFRCAEGDSRKMMLDNCAGVVTVRRIGTAGCRSGRRACCR